MQRFEEVLNGCALKYLKVINEKCKLVVELLPAFKFTGKMVKNKDFTGKW
jgi:hypothetical protein